MRVGTVADFLAELKQQPREVIAEVTTSNAIQLFGI
jgi:Tat protein secretion system quality control protein TatD with DNase activity